MDLTKDVELEPKEHVDQGQGQGPVELLQYQLPLVTKVDNSVDLMPVAFIIEMGVSHIFILPPQTGQIPPCALFNIHLLPALQIWIVL